MAQGEPQYVTILPATETDTAVPLAVVTGATALALTGMIFVSPAPPETGYHLPPGHGAEMGLVVAAAVYGLLAFLSAVRPRRRNLDRLERLDEPQRLVPGRLGDGHDVDDP